MTHAIRLPTITTAHRTFPQGTEPSTVAGACHSSEPRVPSSANFSLHRSWVPEPGHRRRRRSSCESLPKMDIRKISDLLRATIDPNQRQQAEEQLTQARVHVAARPRLGTFSIHLKTFSSFFLIYRYTKSLALLRPYFRSSCQLTSSSLFDKLVSRVKCTVIMTSQLPPSDKNMCWYHAILELRYLSHE